MPESTACVGLDIHSNAADLRMLPQLVDTVEWVPVLAAIAAEAVLVVPGLWLADDPGLAAHVIQDRCSAGRHTLVVPRFRAGALKGVLGSPSSVDISAAEFKSFEWGDHHYPI